MSSPKVSVPKILQITGLTACASLVALATGSPVGIGVSFLLTSMGSVINGYLEKVIGTDESLIPQNFTNIESEALEKCSFDAILKALIITIRQLPNSPDIKALPMGNHSIIEEFIKRIEQGLQKRLDELSKGGELASWINHVSGSDLFWAALERDKNGKSFDEEQIKKALTQYVLTFFSERQKQEVSFSVFQKMLEEGYVVDGKQTHWFEVYCYALISNLNQDNPDYCKQANRLLQNKGIASLLYQQQSINIQLKSLTDWALVQQSHFVQIKQWLENFSLPKSPQPLLKVLELHSQAVRQTHYRQRWLPLLGREEIMEQLDLFLNRDEQFLWWAITGPGGMGKSRLALELCLKYGYLDKSKEEIPIWEAGFLQESELKRFDWARWKLNRSYLLIIDYASAFSESIRQIISDLRQRAVTEDMEKKLTFKVRIILLERLTEIKKDTELDPYKLHWWEFLNRDSDVREVLYNSPLNLPKLSPNIIWELIQDVYQRQTNQILPVTERSAIMTSITQIDPNSRPLFILLIALAISNGQQIQNWQQDDLLKYHLDLDKNSWDKKAGSSNILNKYINLLVLATIIGGLSDEDYDEIEKEKWEFIPLGNDFNEQLYAFMSDIRHEDGKKIYAPLEPDPYGEFFVLEWLKNSQNERALKKAYEHIIKWVWVKKYEHVPQIAYNTFLNYFGHQQLYLLFPVLPEDCSQNTLIARAQLIYAFTFHLNKINNDDWINYLYKDYLSLKVKAHGEENEPLKSILIICCINFIAYLNPYDRWLSKANDEFNWVKDWITPQCEFEIKINLALSITNLVGGMLKTNLNQWRTEAVNAYQWLKVWLASSYEKEIIYQQVRCLSNITLGLSNSNDFWRHYVYTEFQDVRQKFNKTHYLTDYSDLFISANYLVKGFFQSNSNKWMKIANTELDWLKNEIKEYNDIQAKLTVYECIIDVCGILIQQGKLENLEKIEENFLYIKEHLPYSVNPKYQNLLLKSVHNYILGYCEFGGDQRIKKAYTEFLWVKEYPFNTTNDECWRLLFKCTKNMFRGMIEMRNDEWISIAYNELAWVKKSLELSKDFDSQITLSQIGFYFCSNNYTVYDQQWIPLIFEEFKWFKQRIPSYKDEELEGVILSASANVIAGVCIFLNEEQYQWAYSEIQDLKNRFNNSQDNNIRIVLGQAIINFISGISAKKTNEEWLQKSYHEIQWLKEFYKIFINPNPLKNPIILCISAFIKKSLQFDNSKWYTKASTEFIWLSDLTKTTNHKDIIESYLDGAFYIFGSIIKLNIWSDSEVYIKMIIKVIEGKNFTENPLIMYANCLTISLFNPKFHEAIYATSDENYKQLLFVFGERWEQISNWIESNKGSHHWDILKENINQNIHFINMLQAYKIKYQM